MLKNMQSGWEIFTSSPAAYITVDFKKVARDLSHNSSNLVKRECVK